MRTLTKQAVTLSERNAIRKFALTATVRRFTCDPNGIVLPPGLIPDAQQLDFPFHLFGEFDRVGAYHIANNVTMRNFTGGNVNAFLLANYVYGVNTPFFFAAPFNTINKELSLGDLVFMYVDSIDAPAYFHFVVVSTKFAGFASLTSQTNISQIDDNGQGWGAFQFDEIQYTWDNDAQLRLPFYAITTKFDGDYKFETVNPRESLPPYYKPNLKTINIPLQMLVNQYTGLSGYIAFESTALQLLFHLYI